MMFVCLELQVFNIFVIKVELLSHLVMYLMLLSMKNKIKALVKLFDMYLQSSHH